jgi:hypothetical protein
MIPSNNVKLRVLELSCRDPALKKDIHLSIRPSLRFRETEEDPRNAEEA